MTVSLKKKICYSLGTDDNVTKSFIFYKKIFKEDIRGFKKKIIACLQRIHPSLARLIKNILYIIVDNILIHIK